MGRPSREREEEDREMAERARAERLRPYWDLIHREAAWSHFATRYMETGDWAGELERLAVILTEDAKRQREALIQRAMHAPPRPVVLTCSREAVKLWNRRRAPDIHTQDDKRS